MEGSMLNIADTLYQVFQGVVYLVVFIAAFVVAYLTVQQPKIKAWLDEMGKLVKAVVFILLAYWLNGVGSWVVSNLLAAPRSLVYAGNAVDTVMQCLQGLVLLAGLVVGVVLILRKQAAKQ
jgi:hypothetical protein